MIDEKILTEIRSHARGIQFNETELVQLFKTVDKFITDHSPLVDRYEDKNYKTFDQTD